MRTRAVYDYGTGGAYALGAVVSSTSHHTVTGESAKTGSTSGTFAWWDGALQKTSAYDADVSSSSNEVYTTTYTYNGLGQLTHAASIADRQYAPPADQGAYRGGRTAPDTCNDFAAGPDTINAYGQGSAAGSYTVQGGDTLASIAHKLYGDAPPTKPAPRS